MEEMVCPWATDSSLELNYHNSQWGIPVHDDRLLFKMLVLVTMQAGLSWKTVLTKRKGLKKAFDNFSPQVIKEYA